MPDLTVLVPLDGSKPSERALSFLTALKPLASLHVRLLSVSESRESMPIETARREQRLKDYLDDASQRAEKELGCRVEGILRTGKPYAEILDEASRQDVKLILMSTQGWTSTDPESIGSVADKVVRGATCPTLLIGPQVAIPSEIGLITVPLDGSALASQALPVASFFARQLGSRLRLVQAVHYPLGLESDSIGSMTTEMEESMELAALSSLSEAKLQLETSQPVETAILSGSPVEALRRDLKENRPDLMVMTSHGRTGFIHWALGSVADRLIRAGVPVLVLRPIDSVDHQIASLLAIE